MPKTRQGRVLDGRERRTDHQGDRPAGREEQGHRLKDCQYRGRSTCPSSAALDHLAALETVIREQQLEVVIIDPLYLSLLSAETAGSAGNLYAMGAALEPLSRLAQATGCTIILLHHFKKSGIPDPDNPAALEEL